MLWLVQIRQSSATNKVKIILAAKIVLENLETTFSAVNYILANVFALFRTYEGRDVLELSFNDDSDENPLQSGLINPTFAAHGAYSRHTERALRTDTAVF